MRAIDPNDLARNICIATGHDKPVEDICPRCTRRIMPSIRTASTKQLTLTYNDYDHTVNITVNPSGTYLNVHKAEARALARILMSMTDMED